MAVDSPYRYKIAAGVKRKQSWVSDWIDNKTGSDSWVGILEKPMMMAEKASKFGLSLRIDKISLMTRAEILWSTSVSVAAGLTMYGEFPGTDPAIR